MKFPIYLLLLLIIAANPVLNAQQIEGTRGKAVKQATVKISTLSQAEAAGQQFKAPNPGWQIPDWTYEKSRILYKQPQSEVKSMQTVRRETSPLPDTSFAGLMDNNTSIPPDVNGAAGLYHLMETLNTEVRITDKKGINLFTTPLSYFWSSMPDLGGTFDPKITYDPYNGRWIMITPSGGNAAETRIFIGVSTTTNPLDEWHMYWIDPDTTNVLWFDYPNLGFNKNWLSIGGIMRNAAFEAVEFVVFALDLQAMYNGDDDPAYSRFTTTLGSAIVPAFTYDPDQEELYLISTGDGNDEGYGYINLFKLSGSTTNPAFELKGSIGIPEPWENWSYENHGDFLPQLGSVEKINSVDARMHTMINRNNKLWAVHHIYLPADDPQRCAVQWWNLDTAGVVIERGRIDDPTNGVSFAFPGIAVNANEDVLIGHGVFSPDHYAGAGYSFKAYFDDPGSMRTYYRYKDGLASYYKTYGGGRNRWGDYSTVCVDPLHDYDFWAIHEYAELPSGGDRWGTWWAFLKPSFPPQADFVSDEVLIPTGETANFTDLTLGVPTDWSWTFEMGEPASSSDQHPADIQFNSEGSFDVMLITSNALGTDTIEKTDYITVSSSVLPQVDFIADKHAVCTGKTVMFTDLTQYSPNQWQWQFDPSTVTFVNETDETSQHPQVVFDEATTYAVTLTAWNLNGSTSHTKFEMIVAGGYEQFAETFEPDSFRPDEWTILNPDSEVTWDFYETGGTTPGNISAGIDFYHYYAIGNRDRLITPPINLKQTTAFLTFEHAYAKRIPQLTDSLIVLLSDNCGETWTRIFAGGEDGSGNFATHEQTEDFWPEVSADWCLEGYGASCITLELSPWFGMHNLKIAYETWSGYGNPLFIDNIEILPYVGEKETAGNNEIQVYPNPANSVINIAFPDNSYIGIVRLINPYGQVMLEMGRQNSDKHLQFTIDQSWSKGLYIIQFIGKERVVTKEVIIR